MAYTYDDFVKAANQSGLMGQFSQDDLNLAQKYPEFGLSVLSLKKDSTTPRPRSSGFSPIRRQTSCARATAIIPAERTAAASAWRAS